MNFRQQDLINLVLMKYATVLRNPCPTCNKHYLFSIKQWNLKKETTAIKGQKQTFCFKTLIWYYPGYKATIYSITCF